MELFQASAQWAKRPEDERFTSIQALHDVTKAYAATAVERIVDSSVLRVEAIDGAVQIVGKSNVPAKLTHWSFGQVSARAGAPAAYLRQLPATLAVQNINHGLAKVKAEHKNFNMMFHQNGSLLLRSFTTDVYSRLWNWEVAERLLDLQAKGWRPATPDIRRKSDDSNDPHNFSLYASDHDMFAFIMHSDRVVAEPGNELGLKRGLIAGNSEVGGGSLWLMNFLYREMCGNHIIWGAENVVEIRARHVGDNLRGQFAKWQVQIAKYLNESPGKTEQKIVALRSKRIAGTKEELLDALFGKRSLQLSRRALEASYDAVIPDLDGDPLTPWGMAQGITRYSQTTPYADERMELDRAAGKLLDIF